MFFTAPQNTIKEQKKTTETKLETRWNFFRHKLRQEKSFRVIFFNTGHTNIVCPYPPPLWKGEVRRDLREGGGNCLKYLERGWNRKEGRGHKDFKKGGQTGLRGGCLKKGGGGGGWNPLTNYEKILPSNNLSQNKTLPLAIIGRANACYSFMVPSVPFSTPLLPRQFDSKCQQYYNFSFWPSHQHQPIYQAVYGDLS